MKGKECKDHLGNVFSSVSAMCMAYGISVKTFRKRMECKWSLGDALVIPPTTKPSGAVTDHLGNRYNSISEMCKKYGIDRTTYSRRVKTGWSVEDALTLPAKPVYTDTYDHNGQKYRSETKMCQAHGVPRATYRKRKSQGLSIENALKKVESTEVFVDHLGHRFNSLDRMLITWGVSRQAYARRKSEKWSLEHILTTPVKNSSPIAIKDYWGNEFKSINEICQSYNINRATFMQRIRNNWSIQEALTGIRVREPRVRDHLGNKHVSKADMCRKYGVTLAAFNHRRERGMSLEEALTYESPRVFDHEGNSFGSVQEMCSYWRIPRSRFDERIAAEWSLQEALTIPQYASLGESRIKNILDEMGVLYFHNKTIRKVMEILDLLNEYDIFVDKYMGVMRENGIDISETRIRGLRFDFSVINCKGNLAFIEFDGEQHFQFIYFFFRTFEFFVERCEIDQVKQRFSEISHIPLLRIRYDQTDDDIMRFMIADFLNNPSDYIYKHNAILSEEAYWMGFDNKQAELIKKDSN
ncbi:MAG: hypothetical protein IKH28_00705 [Lachnospiraceae bacterium]|nr:hypothetical protein [Lachnospiraceae bacterium]